LLTGLPPPQHPVRWQRSTPYNNPLLFVIPSVPGFSYVTALTSDHLCGSPKENHMHLTEATTLDRKSGEADLSRRAVEGSAVPRIFPGNVFRRA
jgi:hypothetical protein